MVNQMDLPLLDLIVGIHFRILFSKKKNCLFILEQTTLRLKILGFNLNIVNQVSIILLSLFKRQVQTVFEFYYHPKIVLKSEEYFISNSRFDLITLQIQIVGAKMIFCCLVTELRLNNYWEGLTLSMFLLTYGVSEIIDRPSASQSLLRQHPYKQDTRLAIQMLTTRWRFIRSNLLSLLKCSWLYSKCHISFTIVNILEQ